MCSEFLQRRTINPQFELHKKRLTYQWEYLYSGFCEVDPISQMFSQGAVGVVGMAEHGFQFSKLAGAEGRPVATLLRHRSCSVRQTGNNEFVVFHVLIVRLVTSAGPDMGAAFVHRKMNSVEETGSARVHDRRHFHFRCTVLFSGHYFPV